MPFKTYFIALLTLLISFCLPINTFAKEINLYDQPQANGKVVGKVDLAIGIIPIFTPKDNTWMKVGDPRNGNVGWIKQSDINNNGTQTSMSFTRKIISNDNGKNTYQIFQFGSGTPQAMSPDQVKAIQQYEKHQQDMQKAWTDMMNKFESQYPHDWAMPTLNFPMIMPIVVVPAPKPAAQTATPAAK